MRIGKLISGIGAAALLAGAGPAAAALPDMTVAPLSFPVGDAELTVNAAASGALFGPDQPGLGGARIADTGASGTLRLMPSLRRDYDSGLALSLEGTLAASDPLSRGRYDGDALERLAWMLRQILGGESARVVPFPARVAAE